MLLYEHRTCNCFLFKIQIKLGYDKLRETTSTAIIYVLQNDVDLRQQLPMR